jgi:16S rRNA (guanine1207-N2)-methyltransferase
MKSGPAQLLSKMLEGKKAERMLVALPPEPGSGQLFGEVAPKIVVWHQDFGTYLQDAGDKSFGFHPPVGPFDLLAYFLPKGRACQEMALVMAAEKLAPGAALVVVGPKDGGAGSFGKDIERMFGREPAKSYGRHCIGWHLEGLEPRSAEPVEKWLENYEGKAFGRAARVQTLPGAFSHGRLDPATEGLLKYLESRPVAGRVLDWGCGSGVIGTLVQLAYPAVEVVCADTSAVALESTRLTLAANGLSAAKAVACDGWRGIEGKFDMILSNPPAHRGLETDTDASLDFLRESKDRLNPGGRLVIVANLHLPYHRWLKEWFSEVALQRTGSFNLFEAKP